MRNSLETIYKINSVFLRGSDGSASVSRNRMGGQKKKYAVLAGRPADSLGFRNRYGSRHRDDLIRKEYARCALSGKHHEDSNGAAGYWKQQHGRSCYIFPRFCLQNGRVRHCKGRRRADDNGMVSLWHDAGFLQRMRLCDRRACCRRHGYVCSDDER